MFQQRLFIIFATKTVPLSLRIIAALFFVVSAASDPQFTIQSSVSVLGSRFWVMFCIFGIVLLPHLRQLTCQGHHPLSPPIGSIQLILGGVRVILFVHEKYKIPPPPHVDPTTTNLSPHVA